MHAALRSDMRAAFALAACLVAACATTPDDDDLVADGVAESSSDDSKADQADLAFTAVTDLGLKASVGNTEEGRVIRSASSYKSAFGTAPPASLDFSKTWLAVYSAGTEPTGGFHASILHVRLTDSGASVKVIANLDKPGADCPVTQSLTKPIAVVTFAAQSGAAHTTFSKTSTTTACTTATCGAQLDAGLTALVQGMTYMSESDYPLLPFDYTGAGAPTVTKLRTLAGATGSAESRSFAAFFDHATTVFDPGDPAAVEYANRYQALRTYLEANLTNRIIYRFGSVQISVFIVGLDACGNLVGLKTTSIET